MSNITGHLLLDVAHMNDHGIQIVCKVTDMNMR